MKAHDHSLTERIAQHLERPVPKIVRTRARLHLLDWLACVAGAQRSPVGALQARRTNATAIERATWLGNVLEMDDVHRTAILHPGPVVWPVALGLGSDQLDDALDAGVRGYEAMIAMGSMFDSRHYAYWHNTATAGVFGAAAATASRLGADREQTICALGLAGSVTGGFWQMRHEPVMAKQWHLAHAAITGRTAAESAIIGVTGPRYILEGPQGLFAATCTAPRPLMLADAWRISEVSFKPWGACRHAHPAIDAALELKAQGKLEGPVSISTYRDAIIFCDRPDPASVIEAKFSIQHAVAVVMARGVPQLADFEPEAIAELAELRKLVTVVEDEAITAAYPAHFGARIESASGVVALADARGDPERPLDDKGVIDKALALMAWGGVAKTDAHEAVRAVLDGDSVSAIIGILENWR